MTSTTSDDRLCPCGLGDTYDDCCGRLHRGEAIAPTAERLMRSRYSAFAVADADYLLSSWHPSTQPDRLTLDGRQQWLRLEILDRSGGGFLDTEGTVEFRAHYIEDGRPGSQHELSRFVRHERAWTYLGEV